MQEKRLLIAFSALFLVVSCLTRSGNLSTESFHPTGIRTLAVIGIGKGLKEKTWNDLRIGFGLKGMLTEGLYDTGHFQMKEEKQEIRERLGLTEENLWDRPVSYSLEELNRIARTLNADVLAYATVVSFKAPSSGIKIGIFSRQKNQAQLDVRVCIFETASGKRYCTKGTGIAESVSDSLLVQFHDDGRLSTKSLIGNASQKAIRDAIEKLIPGS